MGYSHSQVAHEWAAQHRGSMDGHNMFFVGKTIYSYGYHFPIATHVNGIVLFTTQDYSRSTAKHKTITLRAINHCNIIYVDNVRATRKEEHLENVKKAFDEVGTWLEKAERARTKGDFYRSQALNELDNMKEYTKRFLPRHKFDFTFEGVTDQQSKIRKLEEARRKKEIKARAKAEAERMAVLRERLDEWVAGEQSRISFYELPVRLRITGGNIETSHGASVPVQDALNFFLLCKACKEKGKEMDSFSHKVGSFAPTRITADGDAVIGCHNLEYAEMERIEKLIMEA